jgi:hypothetical protein
MDMDFSQWKPSLLNAEFSDNPIFNHFATFRCDDGKFRGLIPDTHHHISSSFNLQQAVGGRI